MKNTKEIRILIIARIILLVLFILALYFLLPYLLNIFGVKSFVIISGSMSHPKENQAFFESFWKEQGIEPSDLPYRYGLRRGDLVIVDTSPNQTYAVGDVITFKTPITREEITHRVYKYNITHFRDIWDWCINEENLETIRFMVKKDMPWPVSDNESLKDANLIYQAPKFEKCSYYWILVSNIEGKSLLVLYRAGLLYTVLNPRQREEQ